MTAVETMRARVDELTRTIAQLSEERADLEQRIADARAKWRPGQRVLYRNKDEYEITAVRPGYASEGGVKYYGRKVLKSGKLHANTSELWTFDVDRDLRPVGEQMEGKK